MASMSMLLLHEESSILTPTIAMVINSANQASATFFITLIGLRATTRAA